MRMSFIPSALLALVAFATAQAQPARAESVELKVTNVRVARHPMGEGAAVDFLFAEESRRALAAFTAKRVGRDIRIVSGGRVLSTPRLMTPLDGGAGQVSADFKSARAIAARLRRTGRITFEDVP